MKHNAFTKQFVEFLEGLEEAASYARVKKEADKWRKKIVNSHLYCKYKNWNLFHH